MVEAKRLRVPPMPAEQARLREEVSMKGPAYACVTENGLLAVNTETGEAYSSAAKRHLHLTHSEALLLAEFVKHANTYVTIEDLARANFGTEEVTPETRNTICVHMFRLKGKLIGKSKRKVIHSLGRSVGWSLFPREAQGLFG